MKDSLVSSIWLVFTLIVPLAGCVTAGPPVIDAAAGPCALDRGAAEPGGWLIGRWSQPYNTIEVHREGEALVYQWERQPGLVAAGWGEKATASGRGHVVRLAGCAVEMQGSYVASSSHVIVGRPIYHKLTLQSPTHLAGTWYGAGGVWLDTSWRREN